LRPPGGGADARRERVVVVASLLGLAALAWAWLLTEAGRQHAMSGMGAMDGMAGMAAPASIPLALTFLMWAVMMAGMMLPSALPATLLYGSMVRRNQDAVLPATWMFAGGYLAVWAGFALAATLLQTALDASGLLTPAMASASRWLTGALLLLAGIYQWLPLKDACLGRCRAPLQFFLFHWRPGPAGAFRMGAEHGVICVGCCWALMLLLFAVGVMNLLWVALIAGFILIEKLFPGGRLVGRLAGAALALAGIAMIAVINTG
jgi:predicted metal-binding membrane protein